MLYNIFSVFVHDKKEKIVSFAPVQYILDFKTEIY